MIFDTHAHYDDHAFDADREAVIAALQPGGIGHVVDVGASMESCPRVKAIADKYDFIYGALGLHPDEVADLPACRDFIEDDLSDPKIVAVGEIGLDYHWMKETREVQIAAFEQQIEMALRHEMPIIVHSRNAAADTMDVIQKYYGDGKWAGLTRDGHPIKQLPKRRKIIPGPGNTLARKGIIHCYAYSAEQAKIYTALGFYLGIGGVATYGNSRKIKKVIEEIPLEHLVLETDCPYLAPEPHRGERNSSLYLPYVIKAIAEIKGITENEVEETTWENAMQLFGLQ